MRLISSLGRPEGRAYIEPYEAFTGSTLIKRRDYPKFRNARHSGGREGAVLASEKALEFSQPCNERRQLMLFKYR